VIGREAEVALGREAGIALGRMSGSSSSGSRVIGSIGLVSIELGSRR
jgi:hypothetical protein